MHLQNMRFLANEIFKVIKGISPPMVNELFNPNVENIHNLRNISDFSLPIVKIVFSGLKALIYLGPKIQESFPNKSKKIDPVLEFKNKMRLQNPEIQNKVRL